MSSVLKHIVSGRSRRFTEDGFDLDLTCILYYIYPLVSGPGQGVAVDTQHYFNGGCCVAKPYIYTSQDGTSPPPTKITNSLFTLLAIRFTQYLSSFISLVES